jgi:hypothetical protein
MKKHDKEDKEVSTVDSELLTFKRISWPSSADWNKTAVLICKKELRMNTNVIVTHLERYIKTEDLEYIGSYMYHYIYIVGLKTKESYDNLLKAEHFYVNNLEVKIKSVPSKVINIDINWIPPFVADDVIKERLFAYGEVLKINYVKLQDDKVRDVLTTKRKVLIKLRENFTIDDIPTLIKIGGHLCLTTILGRMIKCFKCNDVNHVRKNCTAVKCQKCKRYVNGNCNCETRRTYADVIRKDQQMEDIVIDDERNSNGESEMIEEMMLTNDAIISKTLEENKIMRKEQKEDSQEEITEMSNNNPKRNENEIDNGREDFQIVTKRKRYRKGTTLTKHDKEDGEEMRMEEEGEEQLKTGMIEASTDQPEKMELGRNKTQKDVDKNLELRVGGSWSALVEEEEISDCTDDDMY